jgi:hypothetical protein
MLSSLTQKDPWIVLLRRASVMSSSAEKNLLGIISNQGLGIRKKAREFSLVSVCMWVYFADEHYE